MSSEKHLITRRKLIQVAGAAAAAASLPFAVRASGASKALVYSYTAGWANAAGQAYIGAQLLRERFGYEVSLMPLDPAIAFTAIKTGKADVYSTTYLEGEGAFKGEFRGGMADMVAANSKYLKIAGKAQGPMTQGFAVPEYVPIKSIEEINQVLDKIGGRLIGIEAGAGIMSTAEQAIAAYGLNVSLLPSSVASMQSLVRRAVSRNEWVVATCWEPDSLWNQVKLRYLDDPKNIMMKEPYFNFHSVSLSLKENFPRAAGFFGKFWMDNSDVALVMGWIDEGMKPEDAADKWIKTVANPEVIESWLS
ncbi:MULTISPECIES: glycine betaine ABC transporter substrate-binding protein [unclassified Pseudomonas]|jgi:glycine betaine/proline transport system substrate-binding protein|uniref:glycine betaine ABC transporter substrate-binding protein n=1 Tax=unclassified Pseudomonas TaxID=196821 RepID=UPI0038017322